MAVNQEKAADVLSLVQRHWQKLVALALWLALLGGYFWYAQTNNLGVVDGLMRLRSSVYGPLLYILLYALRPLIFFPASIISVAGGLFFGAAGGILYTLIGSNLSAMVAFVIGHYFGRGMLESTGEATGIVHRYAVRMRKNSFETVLVMRLILLPYDFVNYLSGFLRIDWRSFFLATVIGALPATVSLVLVGVAGNLDDLAAGNISINPWALAASMGFVGVSLLISRYIKEREQVG